MASSVRIELICLSWSTNTCMSMCGSLQKNVAYEFVLTSLRMSCLFYLDVSWGGKQVDRTVAALSDVASRICWKQHVESLWSSHSFFFSSVSLKFRWGSHTVVLTRLQFERIPVLFYQRLDLHIFDNLLMTVYCFPICMLTSFSVDEIFILR